jgi:hypothetical protein
MDFSNIDLNQPADVNWLHIAPPPGLAGFGEEERQFESLANAIRFVMEALVNFSRSTALIKTDADHLTFEEIKLLYSRLS